MQPRKQRTGRAERGQQFIRVEIPAVRTVRRICHGIHGYLALSVMIRDRQQQIAVTAHLRQDLVHKQVQPPDQEVFLRRGDLDRERLFLQMDPDQPQHIG